MLQALRVHCQVRFFRPLLQIKSAPSSSERAGFHGQLAVVELLHHLSWGRASGQLQTRMPQTSTVFSKIQQFFGNISLLICCLPFVDFQSLFFFFLTVFISFIVVFWRHDLLIFSVLYSWQSCLFSHLSRHLDAYIYSTLQGTQQKTVKRGHFI